ncbi:hypothetical protein [Paractinoplanes atraurantiacus]|uniref:Uncharacterized protein n=1 Tax=Paractinoplanes atraurantiacus TaxID=1036182 RepID=A0A285KAN5_9ACTN|nr:hypothetical protein [Actinoplanes atraurantiacus]SNY69645.1 hypothetical protein SAMN05421748_13595 [Actinoplanes atraurantiacus]
MRTYTQTYTVTVADEASARSAAAQLAARGHRFVAVRPWGGEWNALSVLADPPSEGPPIEPRDEIAAVAAIARLHGGSSAGAWGASPMTLRIFPADGRVHEMTQEESERIRAALPVTVAAEVVLPPGLRCRPTGSERKLRRAVLAVVAASGAASPGAAEPGVAEPGVAGLAVDGWDDPYELIEALAGDAGAVPLLAALASAEDIADHYAADALNLLLQMAVEGREQAVARVVPGVPAGRCELTDFLLGALAAAVGAAPPPGLDAIAATYPARRPAVDLMRTPSSAVAFAALQDARPDLVDVREDPAAPVERRALAMLARLGIWELDSARQTRVVSR